MPCRLSENSKQHLPQAQSADENGGGAANATADRPRDGQSHRWMKWTVLGVGFGNRLTWAPEESPVRSDQRPFCATHGTDTF